MKHLQSLIPFYGIYYMLKGDNAGECLKIPFLYYFSAFIQVMSIVILLNIIVYVMYFKIY